MFLQGCVLKTSCNKFLIPIYGNSRIIIFFKKKINVVIFPYQTVLFGSNSRRNYIESFFNGFLKLYENFMISVFPYI